MAAQKAGTSSSVIVRTSSPMAGAYLPPILQLWRNKSAEGGPDFRHKCKIDLIMGNRARPGVAWTTDAPK